MIISIAVQQKTGKDMMMHHRASSCFRCRFHHSSIGLFPNPFSKAYLNRSWSFNTGISSLLWRRHGTRTGTWAWNLLRLFWQSCTLHSIPQFNYSPSYVQHVKIRSGIFQQASFPKAYSSWLAYHQGRASTRTSQGHLWQLCKIRCLTQRFLPKILHQLTTFKDNSVQQRPGNMSSTDYCLLL